MGRLRAFAFHPRPPCMRKASLPESAAGQPGASPAGNFHNFLTHKNKHNMTNQFKNAAGRRLERARAFQTVYSLFFTPVDSQRALAGRFARSIYAEPVAGSEFTTEVFHEEQPGESGASDSFRLPDIHQGNGADDSEQVITAEETAQPEGFAWELVLGVWSKQEELDKLIARYSQNWRIERMGKVELALLRLAAYELLFRDDVPPKVVINEAIELSRQFGDENSRSFVNGILDSAVKAVESGEIKRGSVFWGK